MSHSVSTDPERGDPLRSVAAACAAYTLAFAIPNTSPFAIGGLIAGFPMTEAQAGLMLTCELLAMGAAGFVVAPFVAGASRRRLAILGALGVCGANALALLDLRFGALLVVRLMVGTAAGVLLATANAAIAGAARPARLYGLALMVAWLAAAALGPVLARAAEAYAYAGVYGVWMVLAALVVPLLPGIEQRSAPAAAAAAAPVRGAPVGLAHLAGIVLIGASMMAYYAFIERLGLRIGLRLSQIGLMFAAIAFAGAIGAGLAGTTGTRYGVVKPLIAGSLLHAVLIVIAVSTADRRLFLIGAVGEGLSYMFVLAYQFALAAMLDRSGRWAAAASGALNISTGIGPFLGGTLIAAWGYGSLAWLVVAATLPGAAAFALVGRRLRAA